MNARTTDGTSAAASAAPTSAPVSSAPDPRLLFERAADQMAAVIGSVRAGQLDGPTPCADYDVRGLLGHIVEATGRMARVGEDEAKDEGDRAAEGQPGDEGREGWAQAYAEARARFTEGWADDARLEKTISVPWGVLPGRNVVGGFVMETVTHAWDLAQAIGRGDELDPGLAEFALTVGHAAVGADRRGPEVPFEPVQAVPEGAGVYEELASWLGRRADWSAERA